MREPKVGDIVNYVMPDGRYPGSIRPAIIVAVWDITELGTSNLQVFTDGDNDYPGTDGLLWATSIYRNANKESGTWHFRDE